MRKIKFNDCIIVSKFSEHSKIKNKVLSLIGETDDEKYVLNDSYYGDSISKLDWNRCDDMNRDWVKSILPSLSKEIIEMMSDQAYTSLKLSEIWYQQYEENDKHGWHIHGEHFTGVYYLEYPPSCSKTRICSPFDLRSKDLDVVEGDIIIFPSHWIHSGLPNGKERKTIISFNFSADVHKLNTKILNLTQPTT